MTRQQQQTWQQVLALTQQMRELAKPNDSLDDLSVDETYARQPWQKIAELDKQRLDLLQSFFSSPINDADSEEISLGLAEIMQSDQEVQAIGQSIKKQIGQAFSNMGHAQRVASAYQSNSKD